MSYLNINRTNNHIESEYLNDGIVAIERHCHSTVAVKNDDGRASRLLWVLLLLCIFFIIIEIAGGYYANSIAVMTDACHMLSDSLSIFLSIIAIRISRLPANRRLSFGFHRAEVLGALLSILILCSLTFLLVYLAYRRLTADKLEINVDMMIVTAIAGVAFNLIIFGVIHLSNPSHHSHHSHSSMSNINVRAAFIHALGDFIQCIGVLIAAFIIKFTGWTTADPLCTFLFSIIVLMTTSKIICDIINVLMEGVPSHVDYDSLQDDLKNINNVYTIHDLHIWSLSLNRLALSVHIVIDDSTKAIETTRKADQIVRLKYGIHLATIQVELFDNIMSSCNFCKSL